MSWSRPARLAAGTFKPSSAAIKPVRCATSTEWSSTFCEKLMRNFSRPSTCAMSSCNGGTPARKMASSPALRTLSSISSFTFATTSSMRVGWMRPSRMSRCIASRAISRRTGSKPLNTTAPGVSSINTVTPVSDSNARMFRPSRPMMRPFSSSPVSVMVAVVVSCVCCAA